MNTLPMKVFLLPYAGASATVYSAFRKCKPENIEFNFLELPGRGTKSDRPMCTDFPTVVNQLFEEITELLVDQPYVLFGHSMGSLLAYELYYKITKEGFRAPDGLILSGRIPPDLCIHMKKVADYSENDFVKEVSVYGGLPDEVKENKELRDYFVPILRADFKLIENYIYHERQKPILCDLIVLYGENDPSTPAEDMMQWRKKAGGRFTCIELPGEHFFCMDEENRWVITSCMKKPLHLFGEADRE